MRDGFFIYEILNLGAAGHSSTFQALEKERTNNRR